VTIAGLRRTWLPRLSRAPTLASRLTCRCAGLAEMRARAANAATSVQRLAAARSRQSFSDSNGGTPHDKRCWTRAGVSAARSGTPQGPRNSSIAMTPLRAPGREAATSRRVLAISASARGSNCGDSTGRCEATSSTAPRLTSSKPVTSVAPDRASVAATSTGRSARTELRVGTGPP
jgi:hypothetical protein